MAELTGPEHYQRAEDLLKEATDWSKTRTETERSRILAEAQVHATLALVCSNVYGGGTSKEDMERWLAKNVYIR